MKKFKKIDFSKLKSIITSSTTKLISTSFLTLSALGGLIFGFTKYNASGLNPSAAYDSRLQTTVKIIDEKFNPPNPFEVSKEIVSTLEWIGYIDAEASVLDKETLLVSSEIKSVQNFNEIRKFSDLEKSWDEITTLYSTIFYNSNIEFRTMDDQALFIDGNNDGNYDFVPPNFSTGDEGEVGTRIDFPDRENKFEAKLIKKDGAKVVLDSGKPSIELTPTKQYLNSMKEMMNTLYENREMDPTQSAYVVWFGYDVLREIADNIDPGWTADANGSLYTWTTIDSTQNDLTKREKERISAPFLISVEAAERFLSFEDSFNIGTDLNQEEANQIAERINFSTQGYTLEVQDATWTNAKENLVDLDIVFWILLSIFILISFAFSWYFGLLGMIASLVMTLGAFSSMAMIVTMSLPINMGMIVSIIMILLFGAMMLWNTLSKQKEIYQKKETMWNSYKQITESIVRTNSFSLITFILIGIGVALVTAPINAISVWLLLVSLSIYYVGATFMLPVLSFLVMQLNGRQKIDGKWNYFIGYRDIERKTKKTLITGNRKSMNIGIFSMISLILIGTFTLAITGLTPSASFNNMRDFDSYYRYEIALVDRFEYETSRELIDPDDPNYDPMGQEEFIKKVNEDKKGIIEELSKKDIKEIDSEITKNEDNIIFQYLSNKGFWVNETKYSFTYSLTVTTIDPISRSDINELNVLFQDTTKSKLKNEFEFLPTFSLATMEFDEKSNEFTEGESAKIFNSTLLIRTNSYVYGIMFGFVLATIFILIFFGWTAVVTVSGITLLEVASIFMLFPLLWIPLGSSYILGLFVLTIMSFISRIHIFSEAKYRIREEQDIEKSINQSLKENKTRWFIFNASITTIFVILTSITGITALSGFIIITLGMFLIELINMFVFPKSLLLLEELHKKNKINSHKKAILRQKQEHIIEEEFVKGVNY